MIADALKIAIEHQARSSRTHNALWSSASEGRASPQAIARYLASLRHMIGGTSICLRRARDRALAHGRPELADYFVAKLAEEDGHVVWADEDVVVHEHRFGTAVQAPVEAMKRMLQRNLELIDRDPELYLAYIFWAEYFTVLVGGGFAQMLVERCGMPLEALTCLTKHVELDVDHAEEGMELIDELVADPARVGPLRAVIDETGALFELACRQMVADDVDQARIAS
jgi:hypothetical protein